MNSGSNDKQRAAVLSTVALWLHIGSNQNENKAI